MRYGIDRLMRYGMLRYGMLLLFCIVQICIVQICTVQILMSGFSVKMNSAMAQSLTSDIEQTKNDNNKTQGDSKKLLNRIDFGNAYIVGQTIKSGAVYLLQRKKSEIKSMLTCRKDYRKEILEDFHVQDKKTGQESERWSVAIAH